MAAKTRVQWTNTLKANRKRLGYSMRNVAKAVGISLAAYFRIERGYADVSLSFAMKIAKYLDCTVYDLWTEYQ